MTSRQITDRVHTKNCQAKLWEEGISWEWTLGLGTEGYRYSWGLMKGERGWGSLAEWPAYAGSGEPGVAGKPKEQVCWVTRSVEKESGREPGQETNDPGVAQDISPYAIEKSVNSGWTVNWPIPAKEDSLCERPEPNMIGQVVLDRWKFSKFQNSTWHEHSLRSKRFFCYLNKNPFNELLATSPLLSRLPSSYITEERIKKS